MTSASSKPRTASRSAAERTAWGNGLFIFDNSILIGLWRDYSEPTKKALLDFVQSIALERRWIPRQVSKEFRKKCHEKLNRELLRFTSLRDALQTVLSSEVVCNLPQFAQFSKLGDQILEAITRQQHQWETDAEARMHEIESLFMVGPGYSLPRLCEICAIGEQRYQLDVPPGYMDRSKTGTNKYGDLIIWFEIIDEAKKRRCPVILTSNDRKEDWWEMSDGKPVRPHHNLEDELYAEAGMPLLMYTADQFVSRAKLLLGLTVTRTVLDGVRHDVARQALDDLCSALREQSTPAQAQQLLDHIMATSSEPMQQMRQMMAELGRSAAATYLVPMQQMQQVMAELGKSAAATYSVPMQQMQQMMAELAKQTQQMLNTAMPQAKPPSPAHRQQNSKRELPSPSDKED